MPDSVITSLMDPSSLTTQQLWREIAALKELLEARITAVEDGIRVAHEDMVRVPTEVQKQISYLKELHAEAIDANRNIIETRLDGMDKAIHLLQGTIDRLPVQMDEKIAAATEIQEEKFRSIQTQFAERDARTEQTSRDSKVAVDAALQAAKELVSQQNTSNSLAISKSESTTTKQIEQLGLLIQTGNKASDDKIDDLKQRITRIESMSQGVQAAKTTQQTSNSGTIAIIAVIISLVSVAAFLIINLSK